MTYKWNPSSEIPTLEMSGNMINLIDHTDRDQFCPAVITEFLNKMKWSVIYSHADTQEPLFTKEDMGMRLISGEMKEVDLTEGMYFRWDEAVAYEHAKMMSIGLGE